MIQQWISNFLDKSNKQSQNHRFFHENCQIFHENYWYFEFFFIEITKIYGFFKFLNKKN